MEENIIKIKVIMNNLKHNINPSYNNKLYQEWLCRNELDKGVKFRDWVINSATKEIIKEFDKLA